MTYDIWAFLLIALAVWRVSNMLADTDQSGPLGILDKIRYWAGVRFDEHSYKVVKSGSIADLLTCIYCNSIWVGLLFVIMWSVVPVLTIIVSTVLAFSAVSIFIQEAINGRR